MVPLRQRAQVKRRAQPEPWSEQAAPEPHCISAQPIKTTSGYSPLPLSPRGCSPEGAPNPKRWSDPPAKREGSDSAAGGTGGKRAPRRLRHRTIDQVSGRSDGRSGVAARPAPQGQPRRTTERWKQGAVGDRQRAGERGQGRVAPAAATQRAGAQLNAQPSTRA